MSTMRVTNLKHENSASNNIVLNSDGSVGGELGSTLASKVDYATPTNAQAGTAYTFVADDAERITTASNGSAVTFTIPPQSSVTWGDDTILRVVNYGAGALTVDGGSGVTVTNTATTVAQYGAAVAIRTGSDAWTVVPFGGGDVPAAEVSSPAATGQYTDSGITYDYYTFTATGTLTVDTAGYADVLVIGGGGAGGFRRGGGGGAGGYAEGSIYLESGTLTVRVGGGGAGGGGTGGSGSFSGLDYLVAIGGGGAGRGVSPTNGLDGGSGGGGGDTGATAGSGYAPQGNNGGNGTTGGGGGGGGAGAVGAVGGGAQNGGNGGNGLASSITGSSVTRGGGGGGGAQFASAGTGGSGGGGNGSTTDAAGANGGTNTGGGGGGGGNSGTGGVGGNGGSGVVIIRVKV